MSLKLLKPCRLNFKLFIVSILSVCMTSLISCNKADANEGSENVEEPEEEYYQVYGSSNPYDQIIALIFSKDNDTIMVFGDKDENGVPVRINEMIIRQNDAEGRTTIMFDEEQRPVDLIAPNGVRMLLEWLDESSAALTLVEPSTGEQLNTVVYFDGRNQTDRINYSTNTRKGSAVMKIDVSSNTNYSDQQLCEKNGITGYVIGYTCHDMPDNNGPYYVRAFKKNLGDYYGYGIPIGYFPCRHVSDNQFEYTIPENIFPTHEIDMQAVCEPIASFLSNICSVYLSYGGAGPIFTTTVCAAVTTVIATYASLGTGLIGAAAYTEACAAISAALSAYCSTFGYSPGSGAPSLGEYLCGLIKPIRWTETSIRLVSYLNAWPHDVVGSSVIYEKGSGQPDYLYVASSGNPAITSFTLDPPAPAVEQSYIATAHIVCVPYGTNITMSIVGTDGYTNSETQYISQSVPYLDATLWVPGAHESGIYDVCTTTVVLPDGTTLTKTASLVFQ